MARDRKQGERLELTGTPSIFINGRRFESAGEFKEDLEEWVALEIKLSGGNATPHLAEDAPSNAPPSASAAPAASAKAAVKDQKPRSPL